MRVIDATYGTSVVAGLTHLRRDETVLLAELFCGSYNGWSQGAYVLREMGYDVSVCWLLDHDPACVSAASLIHDGALQLAQNFDDLRRYAASACDVMAVADLTDTWWHGLCALPGVGVWAASPPCQPWSTASWGPGLSSGDGKLLLHLLALLEVYQPPCLVLEQVAGFRNHPHYGYLKSTWESIGYRLVWDKV